MVTEQDHPPPLTLVNRRWTGGGHGVHTVDEHWITSLKGPYDRGEAHGLDRHMDRSRGTACSFGYTQHPRNTRGCDRADANGRLCGDDSALDRMQTAGALLDRTLQHTQVTSGRGVAWRTTSAVNTVYEPDRRREKSVGSAGKTGGNWRRARPLRAWGVCYRWTSAGCRRGRL
jgi:hypothetical protein